MDIVKNDPEFRKELRAMIADALRTELQRLRTELLGITDASFNLNDILQKEFAGCQITKWNYFDDKGSVYGFAETIDVDVIKRGNDTFLCNIKETIDIADVVLLIRIGKLYRNVNPNITLSCVIITRHITPKARKICELSKIKVLTPNDFMSK